MEIIPNPFSEVATINISFPYTDKATVKIYNYIGQQVAIVFEQEAIKKQAYKINFDGKHLNNGIYFVVVRTNQETKISKVVVSK
mgnify:CR=1 FL=1